MFLGDVLELPQVTGKRASSAEIDVEDMAVRPCLIQRHIRLTFIQHESDGGGEGHADGIGSSGDIDTGFLDMTSLIMDETVDAKRKSSGTVGEFDSAVILPENKRRRVKARSRAG